MHHISLFSFQKIIFLKLISIFVWVFRFSLVASRLRLCLAWLIFPGIRCVVKFSFAVIFWALAEFTILNFSFKRLFQNGREFVIWLQSMQAVDFCCMPPW